MWNFLKIYHVIIGSKFERWFSTTKKLPFEGIFSNPEVSTFILIKGRTIAVHVFSKKRYRPLSLLYSFFVLTIKLQKTVKRINKRRILIRQIKIISTKFNYSSSLFRKCFLLKKRLTFFAE